MCGIFKAMLFPVIEGEVKEWIEVSVGNCFETQEKKEKN